MHIKGKEYRFKSSDIRKDMIYGEVKIDEEWINCAHNFNGDIKIIGEYYVQKNLSGQLKLEI